LLIHGGGSFMAVAPSWRLLVHGSYSFMVAARPWRVHSSCSFIVVAHSWRQLVHGSRLFMAAACLWQPLVYGSRSSMAAACPWRPLVHGGCSSIHNCAILEGNSCGLYDENHMISNHSCVGGTILPRSILHYTTKHFAFCQEAFCILPQSISYGFLTEL
jgi:hypothetical protein